MLDHENITMGILVNKKESHFNFLELRSKHLM